MAIPGNANLGSSNLYSNRNEQIRPMRQLNAKIRANDRSATNCSPSSIYNNGNINAELTANSCVNMMVGFLIVCIKNLL